MNVSSTSQSLSGSVNGVRNGLKELLVTSSVDLSSENGSKNKRSSDLDSAIMLLSGHSSDVLTCSFSPDGNSLASGSLDKLIFLWKAKKDCINYAVLEGHTGAVTQVKWANTNNIISSSSDKTVCHWSHETEECIRKHSGHTSYVNTVDCVDLTSYILMASGSDDSTAILWDSRRKKAIHSFKENYQVLSVALSKDGSLLFCAGIDGKINVWDVRNQSVAYSINAHSDAITGMKLNPEGQSLLSFGADNTPMIFDVRPKPYENTRQQNTFEGCAHGFEKNLVRPCWSPDGYYVACGSADKTVMIWDVVTRDIIYKLPGHKGAVTEVDWWDNLIVSSSTDCTLFLGELDLEKVKF